MLKVALDVNEVDMMETQWLRGHEDSVIHVAYSVNGDLLATAAMDGLVKIWPTPDHNLLHTLEGPGEEIEWIDWHPKGDIILAGSSDYSSWMWNARTGVCMQVECSHCAICTLLNTLFLGVTQVCRHQPACLSVWC